MKKWLLFSIFIFLIACGSTAFATDDTTIKGTTTASTDASLNVTNSTPASILYCQNDMKVGIQNTAPGALLDIGTATSVLGTLRLEGNTSGYCQLQPTAAAGSVTITFPATTGTVALTANKLSVFAATTSSELAGVISDETGTAGKLVFDTAPTFATSITTPVMISTAADPADAGAIRLGNAELIEWEASPAGTDITLTVDSSEVMQASGTFNAVTLTEGGVGVPNVNDNLSVFAATTSLQFIGVISDETGTGKVTFATAPTFTTSITTPIVISAAADPADAGAIRLGNAELIEWEASPAGTDVTLTVDASEIMQASGTFNAVTLTENGTGVPNTGDNLSVFAATTSAQLAGVISDEQGSGALVFATTPTLTTPVIGAATGTSVVLTGAITSSSATAGIGYATGAGGLVTQITSKSTGVSINKMSGQITMQAAALGAGAVVTFTVTNTSCGTTDVPVVAIDSGGTANAYTANVVAVGAGSFAIQVKNVTAGSLSEAPVISFVIIKAVTA